MSSRRESHVELRSVFDQLVTLSVDEQRRQLDGLRKSNPELVVKLEAMLAHDAELQGFTAKQSIAALEGTDPLIGSLVGPYRVLKLLGHGGMGRVYLAERSDGRTKQRVAIKTLHRLITHDLRSIERFNQERETLSRLEHRNIARLIDAQELPNGTPYMVMDYIDGVPIDQYCAEHQLGLEDSIKLFIELCDGVDYAHRNLVIHRDIKPNNVLIAADGSLRLLDFGVAKELDQNSDLTQDGDRLFSPHYASPEQIIGSNLSVATDIYSLGALLYLLLTRSPVFMWDELSPLDAQKAIVEREPMLPSTRVRLAKSPFIQLARKLEGDLDAIVLKCLRKDPEQRYRSAQDLKTDIQNYLQNKPVLARPGSSWYRLRKLVLRHATLVAVCTIASVTILASLLGLWQQKRSADAQRFLAEESEKTAQATLDFMVETFEIANPDMGLGNKTTVGELFSQAVRNLANQDFSKQPDLFQRMQVSLGRALTYAGELELLEEVLQLAGPRHSAGQLSADQAYLTAALQRQRNELHEALATVDTVIEDSTVRAGLKLELLLEKALTFKGLDDHEAAKNHAQQIIDEIDAQSGGRPAVYYRALLMISRIALEAENELEASAVLDRAVQLADHDFPGANAVQLNLLNARYTMRRNKEGAMAIAEESLALTKKLYGENTQSFISGLNRYASQLARADRNEEAIALSEDVLARTLALYGRDHPSSARGSFNLGLQLIRTPGYIDRGFEILQDAIAIGESTWPPDHFNLFFFGTATGHYLVCEGRFPEALPVLEAAMQRAAQTADFQSSEIYALVQIGLEIAKFAEGRDDQHATRAQEILSKETSRNKIHEERLQGQIEAAKLVGLELTMPPAQVSVSQ